MKPKAFISCSFDPQYDVHRAFVVSLVESCGFEPILLISPEGKSVPEKIRDAIASSRLLIAVLFCAPSEYVLNEIGMAYSQKKDILVFKVEGVEFKGVANAITDYATFRLDRFWLLAPDMVRLLNRGYSKYASSFNDRAFIIRKSVKTVLRISDSHIETTTEVTLLNLAERLGEVNHGLVLYNDLERSQREMAEVEAVVLDPPMKSRLTKRIDDSAFSFTIQFARPIRKGETVTYMYVQKLPNYYPKTKRALAEVIASGRYHTIEPFCEKHFTVSTPTEFLELKVEFPRFYQIDLESVWVTYYKADIPMEEEMARIRSDELFRRETFAGVTTLELRVPFPKLFGTYTVRWQPCD